MKKIFALALAALLVFALAGCGTPASSSQAGTSTSGAAGTSGTPAGDSFKIAMVQGVRGDAGFNDQAYKGIEMAAADFPIEYDVMETTDLTEVDAALRNYADTGEYDLIIAVSANYAETVQMVASDYPEQKFSLVDTILETPMDNVHCTAAIDAEQGFLSGVLSGLVTKGDYADAFPRANADKNVIVYAGGTDSPTSRAGAAGFMAGVLYVNPDCEIIYNIVGSYNDPVKAKEIAMNGVARGADIITGNCGGGSMGLNEAAKEAGCYFIATSMGGLDPDCSLCTSVKLTENMVYNEVKSLAEGTWAPGGEREGIVAGYCDISLEGTGIDYPAEVVEIIDAVREQVRAGELTLPTDVDQLDAWKAENQYAA